MSGWAQYLWVLLIFLFSQDYEVTSVYWYLPVLLFIELSLLTGFAFWMSLLVPVVPDLKFVVERGFHLLFLLSGIFFDGSQLQPDD